MIKNQVFETILFLLSTEKEIDESIFLNTFNDRHPASDKALGIFKNLYHMDYLRPYTGDILVKEIILHGPTHLQTEKENGLESHKLEGLCPITFKNSLEVLAHKNNISWNFTDPYPSFFAKVQDLGFRATLVHPCTGSENLAKLFLRRVREKVFKFNDFKIQGGGARYLRERVLAGDNIVISGKAGSGKTSFLSTLMEVIPKEHHLVILEDTREIPRLSDNHSFFLGKEGTLKKTLKDFYSLSLRLRPDRIILGEIRSFEIVPLILSLNTGARGLLSTVHSDSAPDALVKMALLFNLYGQNPGFSFENSLKIICKNIDLVVFIENQEIKEIIKVIGSTPDRALYENKLW